VFQVSVQSDSHSLARRSDVDVFVIVVCELNLVVCLWKTYRRVKARDLNVCCQWEWGSIGTQNVPSVGDSEQTSFP